MDYNEVLKLSKDNIHALYNRGICFEKIGEYKKSIEDFGRGWQTFFLLFFLKLNIFQN